MQDDDAPPLARFETADGALISVHDFGGEGEPLLLAHATGFHAFVLQHLARALPRFHCYALDFRAHGCSMAPEGWGGEWEAFASDVLAVVDGLGLDQPWAFGHSCGGTSLLLAEERRPGTFRGIFGYEPVVPPLLEPAPPTAENPLAIGATRRREWFESKEAARANYASKPPLSNLDPAVLEAYVVHGFEPESGADGAPGVRLRCRSADEAKTFAHAMSHTAFAGLPNLKCPITLACGRLTDAFGEDVLGLVRDRVIDTAGVACELQVVEELGHFGPMERPVFVGQAASEAFA